MKRKTLKGSYTVEASVVVSLTILVLAALIIAAFYVHDRSVLQGAACEAAVTGSIFATEEERSEAAAQVKKRVTSSLLLGSQNLDGYVTTGSKQSMASWKATYPVPGFAAKYLTGNQLPIKVSWTCRIHDPAKTIRLVRGIAGIADMVTGGDN